MPVSPCLRCKPQQKDIRADAVLSYAAIGVSFEMAEEILELNLAAAKHLEVWVALGLVEGQFCTK